MEQSSVKLGLWMAGEASGISTDRQSVSLLVLGSKSVKEVIDLVTPLSRKLESGLTVWAQGLTEKSSDAPDKVEFRMLEPGHWDVAVFSPRYVEAMGVQALQVEVMQALLALKTSPRSSLVLCVPTTVESNPVTLRNRM